MDRSIVPFSLFHLNVTSLSTVGGGGGQRSEKQSEESIWTFSWCSTMRFRYTTAPTASIREEWWSLNVQTEVINKRWLGRERGNCMELAHPHDYQWLRRRTKLKAWWKTCGPIRRRKQKPDTCDNTPPDLLISQLNFSFGVLRKSKAISERVGCCFIPSANRDPNTPK